MAANATLNHHCIRGRRAVEGDLVMVGPASRINEWSGSPVLEWGAYTEPE